MTYHTPEAARAFWASLDEKSKLELAKVAPSVVRPWSHESPGGCGERWVRFMSNWEDIAAQVKVGSIYHPWSKPFTPQVHVGNSPPRCDTIEAAKSAVDTRLREMGFVLEEE